MSLSSNVTDTALIFEGGGMRASYTAGFLNTLLQNNIHINYVAGISAGSSHCVNYLLRDTERARRSFVEFVQMPNIGGWSWFLRGEGYFRSRYIYFDLASPGGPLPLNFEAFMANPARLRIGAFERESGAVRYFGREDIHNISDLKNIVCSSSSMPFLMPPNYYNGNCYLDGGLGGGIALDIAKKDGLKKFFVILTREKNYKKSPARLGGVVKACYRKYPQVAEAILNRSTIYNQTLEELKQLESEGRAFLVYPDFMPISNTELNYKRVLAAYNMGLAQGARDLPAWKRFLQIEG